MAKRPTQVKERPVSIETIMRTTAFRRGVVDVRAGRKPRFDQEADGPSSGWYYERGRQFATIAPRHLPIVLPLEKQLNPEALEFFRQHKEDIC
jgi:hypothetical protein